MSSAESLLPIWPPVLGMLAMAERKRGVGGEGDRKRDVPVEAFDLYRLAVFDGAGGGDWGWVSLRTLMGFERDISFTYCQDAICSGASQ